MDSAKLVRRQAVPLAAGSTPAIVILLAMVLMLATGIAPPVLAVLVAAGELVATKLVAALGDVGPTALLMALFFAVAVLVVPLVWPY